MDVTIIKFLYFPPHWLLRIVFNWPNQVLAWINFFLCVKRKQLIVDSFAGNDGHSNWLTLLQFRLNQSLSKSKMVARNRISINSVVVKPLSHCMFGWIKRAVAKRKGKAIRVITSKILHAFQFFLPNFHSRGHFYCATIVIVERTSLSRLGQWKYTIQTKGPWPTSFQYAHKHNLMNKFWKKGRT